MDANNDALSLHSVVEYLKNLEPGLIKTESERREVLEALILAQSRLETAWETARKICMTQPMVGPVLTVCNDVELFRKWVEERGGRPQSIDELVELTGLKVSVLGHLLRQLSAQKLLRVESPGVYSLTPFTRALTKRPWTSLPGWLNEFAVPGALNFPKYMRAQNYDPISSAQTNWHHFRSCGFFEDCERNPDLFEAFHDGMGLHTASKLPWTDIIPPSYLLEDARHGSALLVDIGGAQGGDIEQIRKHVGEDWYPNLILEDLPSVVDVASVHEGVKKIGYDFFTPQPIKGSRAYYMHAVLHDWPDDKALEILKNVAEAMDENYSVLLIHEIVLGDQPGETEMTIDMYVWMNFGQGERTDAQWRELLDKAGLEITRIRKTKESFESVIEATKRSQQ